MSQRMILSGVLFAWLCCLALSGAQAHEACGKRTGDQVWLFNTRGLGCSGVTEALPDYRVEYFAQNAWYPSDAAAFFKEDNPAQSTVVFIHGNRFSPGDAIESGWQAYHTLTRCLPPEQHIRFVIWSWPSDKVRGQIRDVRAKSCRTYVEGYYLARLMTKIDPQVPTGLVGYSFGSRVALGAAHLAGGGQLDGRVVPDLRKDAQSSYRIAMLAAGVEDDGLLPGANFQMAMARTDLLLNFYNSCDPALKRYRFTDKCTRPTAMGYSGIVGDSSLGPAGARIRERDVAGIIGKTHESYGYLNSESIMGEIRREMIGGVIVPATVAKSE
jgi:hypothetical protein